MPGKHPDQETQKEFVKEIYKIIDKVNNSNDEILFLDPTHQVYNVENGYCWQEIGRDGTKIISSNTGRRRMTILGALNPISLKPTALVTESNCDQEAMKVFLNEIRKEYPNTDTIHAILDNARYHYAKSVKEKAKELKIRLIFLPPYCPNLNLIERLWKFLKKKLKKNKFYDTFEKFTEAIYKFFKNIKQHKEELKRLLTLNFEII